MQISIFPIDFHVDLFMLCVDHNIPKFTKKKGEKLKKMTSINMGLVTLTDIHFNPKMNIDMHSHSHTHTKNTFISHKYAHSHRSVFMYS